MESVRTVVGGAAMLAGTWWWAEAGAGDDSILDAALSVAGWLLLTAAAMSVLRALAPGVALLAAGLVAAAGVVLLLWVDGWPTGVELPVRAAPLVVASGLTAVLWPGRRIVGPEQRTVRGVLWPSQYAVYRPGSTTTVVAMALGDVTLDVSRADRPVQPHIHLFVRVFGGRVTLVFPPDWVVVPWHVDATHAVALHGYFTSAEPDEEPATDDGDGDGPEASRLRRRWWAPRSALGARRPARDEGDTDDAPPVVRTSISGIGGSVTIVRA